MTQPHPSRIRSTEFRPLFRMIVRATIASCCVAACSTETQLGENSSAVRPPDAGDDAALPPDAGDRYTYLECGRGVWVPELPAPLQTTPSAESVAIYRLGNGHFPTPSYGLRAEFGPVLCADEDDACHAAVHAAMAAAPCSEDPDLCPGLALHKQGDTLSSIQSREELLAFFGEIDSVAEAVLLAAFDGRIAHCAQPGGLELKGTGIYQDAEGFHIQSEYDNCVERVRRERYTVAVDGSLRDDGSEDLGPALCAIGRRPEGVGGAHPASRTP